MLLFSICTPLLEFSSLFSKELDGRDEVVANLDTSFLAHIRGEQTTEKPGISDEDKIATCFDAESSLLDNLFPKALALKPIAVSLLIPKRSGEKNSKSFISRSTKIPFNSFAYHKGKIT